MDRLEKIVSYVDTPIDIQQKVAILCKTFDNEFKMLTNVATIQPQTKHDGKILNNMCTNIRNDAETLNICIKALR